jgi:hypothetical protein
LSVTYRAEVPAVSSAVWALCGSDDAQATIQVSGSVRAPGLVQSAELRGEIRIAAGCPIYDLAFEADDGKTVRFVARKPPVRGDLYAWLTILRGTLLDEGARPLGVASLRFDARGDLGPAVRSIRLLFT